MFKKRIAVIFVLAIIIITHLIFSLQRIKNFTGGDETLWSYQRVPDFWGAVKTHNWKKTAISDKPGITLALVSGMGLPFIPDPGPYGDLMYSSKTANQLNTIGDIYFYLRLPILIFSFFALLVFFFLIEKLLGTRIALMSTVLIGLSPILLGMSIYINSDSLLWIFIPLTILSFLVYQKFANWKYLALSGIFLGLALLTKYVAVILFPFLFTLIFLKYIFDDNVKEKAFYYFKKSFVDYLLLLLISTAVIALLFPAIWVRPKMMLDFSIASRPILKIWPIFLGIIFVILLDALVLKRYFCRKISDLISKYRIILIKSVCFIAIILMLFAVVNTYSGMRLINFPTLLSNPRAGANQTEIIHFNSRIISNILASFYSLIFGLTPFVAIAFFFTIIFILKSRKDYFSTEKNNRLNVAFYLVFFILVYYVASSILGVSSIVRYQISLFPIASIIAAIGLSYVLEFERMKAYFTANRFYILIVAMILLSAYSLYLIKPFYLEYSSSFLPKKYSLNLDNSGDGSSEISQYLNNLPDARNLYVWTDIRQVCEKFVGKCAFGLKTWQSSDANFDYFVVPVAEQDDNAHFKNNLNELKIGSSLVNASDLYAIDRNYDFKITIDDRPITTVKIIKNNTR